MKVKAGTNISNINTPEDVKRFTGIFAAEMTQILNGNLTFSDNFFAKIITFVFPAANTTIAMFHGLGNIPVGYILIGSNAALSLFDGNGVNTTTTLYLQASAAGTARVLVLG